MAANPIKRFTAKDDIIWVYLDKYEVAAPTEGHAEAILRQHGFLNIDLSKLKHKGTKRPLVPVSDDFERKR